MEKFFLDFFIFFFFYGAIKLHESWKDKSKDEGGLGLPHFNELSWWQRGPANDSSDGLK